MNRLTIIGNLTRDPELRSTQSGKTVCSFSVAVNRRRTQNGQPEADFFRVSAWGELGENCGRYLAKGRKVAVIGSVSVSTFQGKNGQPGTSLDVLASEVEFLSPRDQESRTEPASPPKDEQTGMEVVEDDDLPF